MSAGDVRFIVLVEAHNVQVVIGGVETRCGLFATRVVTANSPEEATAVAEELVRAQVLDVGSEPGSLQSLEVRRLHWYEHRVRTFGGFTFYIEQPPSQLT